jgi:hypothetical protein
MGQQGHQTIYHVPSNSIWVKKHGRINIKVKRDTSLTSWACGNKQHDVLLPMWRSKSLALPVIFRVSSMFEFKAWSLVKSYIRYSQSKGRKTKKEDTWSRLLSSGDGRIRLVIHERKDRSWVDHKVDSSWPPTCVICRQSGQRNFHWLTQIEIWYTKLQIWTDIPEEFSTS